MKKFLTALAILALVLSPAFSQTGTNSAQLCNKSAIYDAATNGSTRLVTASGRQLYICGYSIYSAGTVNVKLIAGTGTTCATGSRNLTPAYQFTAQTGIVDPSFAYRGMGGQSGEDICINASAGIAVQAVVYYGP